MGGIILKWFFKKCGGEVCAGLIWFEIGTGACAGESGNKPSRPIKCGVFLDQLRVC